MACARKNDRGETCSMAPIPGPGLCIEHLFIEACAAKTRIPIGTIVEALGQIVDGAMGGATVSQQLSALDLLGQFAGLDGEDPMELR
jgi:hypothetical protein